jgi:hypothetical protein
MKRASAGGGWLSRRSSRRSQNRVIRLTSCILDCCENVFALEIWIVIENFFEAGARSQEFENVGHANTHTPNARTTTTLSVVDRDAIEAFRLHVAFISLQFESSQRALQKPDAKLTSRE